MSKTIGSILGSVLLSAAVAGEGKTPTLSGGTLRFVVVGPVEKRTDPAFGFDRDVLSGFAREQRLELQTVPVGSWDDLAPALLAKRGDVIGGGVTVTEARAKLVAFTTEVFRTRALVVTRRPIPPVNDLEVLRRLRVGTVRGTSLATVVAGLQLPPDNVDDSIPTGQLVEALRDGRISAFVMGVEDAVPARTADPELQLGMFVGPQGQLAFGVRQDAPVLLAQLNAYLRVLRSSPNWNALVTRHYGRAAIGIFEKLRGE